MHKQMGAIMLVAGTCIGSGMIALPMMLSKLGIIPSIALIITLWSVIYYTCLVNIELNLQAGKGLDLGSLGKKFSGNIANIIGTGSYKILSYALLAVYLYGGSSVIKTMLLSYGHEFHFNSIASIYALTAMILFILPLKYIDYINRLLFIGLMAIIAILVIGLLSIINWNNLPLFADQYQDVLTWRILIPVTFTCFGFQVIFHTLTNYCNKNSIMLKRTFLWGSLIPVIVYIIWTSSVLSAVYQNSPSFYLQMVNGEIEVGDLISALSHISNNSLVQMLVWWLSILAIVTSVLGVGLALCDSVKEMLPSKLNHHLRNVLAAVITVSPAYLVTILIPNAFLAALGFAGMILVVIAILLPIYLLSKIKGKKFHYPELNSKWLLAISVMIGVGIIICEISNMIKI